MIEIFDLIGEIKTFYLLSQVNDQLMNFSKNLKSKLWTKEILTNNLNEIIQNFVQSDIDDPSDFFKIYLESMYPSNLNKQKNYCYLLILSLVYFKQKFNYFHLYYDLLHKQNEKKTFFFFLSCKNEILMKKNIPYFSYQDLDKIYLNDQEWIFVLNQILGYDINEIKDFKTLLDIKIKNAKHDPNEKLLKYQKSNQISLYFFLREIMQKFLNNKDEGQIKHLEDFQRRKTKNPKKKKSNDNVVTQRLQDNWDLEGINNEDQKKILVKQIKQTIAMKNNYKNATINLLSFMHQIDPIYTEIIEQVDQHQKTLKKIKKDKIQGKKYEEMTSKMSVLDMKFLETGTILNTNNFKNTMKILLNENVDQYKMLSLREKEKRSYVQRIVRELREKIFDEKFLLFREGEGKNIELLKKELENLFLRYDHLQNSDFVILNTFFNNFEENEEFSMNKVLNKITNRLMDVADNAVQNSDEDSEEKIESRIIKDTLVLDKKKIDNNFDSLEKTHKITIKEPKMSKKYSYKQDPERNSLISQQKRISFENDPEIKKEDFGSVNKKLSNFSLKGEDFQMHDQNQTENENNQQNDMNSELAFLQSEKQKDDRYSIKDSDYKPRFNENNNTSKNVFDSDDENDSDYIRRINNEVEQTLSKKKNNMENSEELNFNNQSNKNSLFKQSDNFLPEKKKVDIMFDIGKKNIKPNDPKPIEQTQPKINQWKQQEKIEEPPMERPKISNTNIDQIMNKKIQENLKQKEKEITQEKEKQIPNSIFVDTIKDNEIKNIDLLEKDSPKKKKSSSKLKKSLNQSRDSKKKSYSDMLQQRISMYNQSKKNSNRSSPYISKKSLSRQNSNDKVRSNSRVITPPNRQSSLSRSQNKKSNLDQKSSSFKNSNTRQSKTNQQNKNLLLKNDSIKSSKKSIDSIKKNSQKILKKDSLKQSQKQYNLSQKKDSLIHPQRQSNISQKKDSLINIKKQSNISQKKDSLINIKKQSNISQKKDSLINPQRQSNISQKKDSLINPSRQSNISNKNSTINKQSNIKEEEIQQRESNTSKKNSTMNRQSNIKEENEIQQKKSNISQNSRISQRKSNINDNDISLQSLEKDLENKNQEKQSKIQESLLSNEQNLENSQHQKLSNIKKKSTLQEEKFSEKAIESKKSIKDDLSDHLKESKLSSKISNEKQDLNYSKSNYQSNKYSDKNSQHSQKDSLKQISNKNLNEDEIYNQEIPQERQRNISKKNSIRETKNTYLQSIVEENDENEQKQKKKETLITKQEEEFENLISVEKSSELIQNSKLSNKKISIISQNLENSKMKKQTLKEKLENLDSLKNQALNEIQKETQKNSLQSSNQDQIQQRSTIVENFDSFKNNLDDLNRNKTLPDETLLMNSNPQVIEKSLENSQFNKLLDREEGLSNLPQQLDSLELSDINRQKEQKPDPHISQSEHPQKKMFKRALDSKKGQKIAEITGITQSQGKKDIGGFFSGFWK